MSDGEIVPGGRALALRRNEAMSKALRRAARELDARSNPASAAGRLLAGTRAVATLAGPSRYGRFVAWSFLLAFALPALAVAIYYALVASPIYVSEARVAVRSGEKGALDALSAVNPFGQVGVQQDTLIVAEYFRSRALVEELDRRLDLRAVYRREGADWFARLGDDVPVERLVLYWRWRSSVSIEMNSGILTLQVQAFAPEDARRVLQEVVALSETLVNDMTNRAQADQLAQAEAEMVRAEENLKAARAALQTLRDAERLLDPALEAEGLSKLLTEARAARAAAQEDLEVARRSLGENAPQIRRLKARIAALDDQIAELEASLADRGSGLSASIGRFEDLELRRDVAERQYARAATALEAARVAAERQRTYLNVFVEPQLAQEAIYPRRFLYAAAAIAALFVAWLALVSAAGFVRNRMA